VSLADEEAAVAALLARLVAVEGVVATLAEGPRYRVTLRDVDASDPVAVSGRETRAQAEWFASRLRRTLAAALHEHGLRAIERHAAAESPPRDAATERADVLAWLYGAAAAIDGRDALTRGRIRTLADEIHGGVHEGCAEQKGPTR
jgi:hypothetical protein